MQKRDPFPLRADARLLVDELHPRRPATRQRCIQVVDGEADVMDAGTPPGDKARDGGIGVVGLQQLHQGLPRAEAGYAGAVGVIQRNFGQSQHIPEKRQALGEGFDRDSDVGYARSTRG